MVPMALLNHLIHPIYAAYKITGPGIAVTQATAGTTLETILSSIVGVISIVGVLFFGIQFIFAGFAFLGAQGDSKKIEIARDRIGQSILGLFIILIALFFTSLIATIAGIHGVFNISDTLNTLSIH